MNQSGLLFDYDPTENLLPKGGQVFYYGSIFNFKDSHYYFSNLMQTVPWRNDEAVIYDKRIITDRKVAWVGDKNYSYTYSGTTKHATVWTSELLDIKNKIEALLETKFNSCLLNLYHSGSEGMAWHSDDEMSLGHNTTIASVSLGAPRKFSFKHKITKETVSLTLEHGSLLVMKGETQTYWQHSLPKATRVEQPRINLTFRTIVTQITSK